MKAKDADMTHKLCLYIDKELDNIESYFSDLILNNIADILGLEFLNFITLELEEQILSEDL